MKRGAFLTLLCVGGLWLLCDMALAQVMQLGSTPSQVKTFLTIDLDKITGQTVSFTCQMNKWISEPQKLTSDAIREAGLNAGHDYFAFRIRADETDIGNPAATVIGPIENTLFICCDRNSADYIFANLSRNERYSQDANLSLYLKKLTTKSGARRYVGWVQKIELQKNPGDAVFDGLFPGARGK